MERTFGFCSCFHVFMAQIIAVINNTDTGHGRTLGRRDYRTRMRTESERDREIERDRERLESKA